VTRRWSVAKLVVACVATLGVLGAGTGTASASGTYQALCSAPAICSGLGGYSFPFGVAVDNSGGEDNGDVYVASVAVEGPPSSVERFTAFGQPAPFSGANPSIGGADRNFLTFPGNLDVVSVAVNSAGDFYVTSRAESPNTVDEFSPTGEPLGSFALPAGVTAAVGIAVDDSGGPSNGDIWVGDEATHVIDKFSPAGHLETTIPIPNGGNPYSLAVDAHGNVYDGNHGENVLKFSESGASDGVFDNHASQSVGFDPSTDEIFVVNEGGAQIQPYTEAGAALTPFSTGGSSGEFDPGVAAVHHFVYVADFNHNEVEMYGAGEAPKEAPMTGAYEVHGTTVKLHGTLNPGGTAEELEYQFDYNTGGVCAGGEGAPALGDYVANAKEKAVQTEVKNLAPGTEYTYCLVSLNPFGPLSGSSFTFTTEAGAPIITDESAAPEALSAKVSAMINPGGAGTTCVVEYGEISVSEHTEACPALPEPAALTPQPVTVELKPLTAVTKYHYRFTATNSVEKVEGAPEEFETKALVEVITGAATTETSDTATLNGEIKTGSEGGSYQFEYGTGSDTEHMTPIKPVVGETTGFMPIAEAIAGLTPNTTYRFRIIGYPPGGSPGIEGAEREFTTKPALPMVINKPVSNITRTTASLSGAINPGNSPTTYYIEYGETENYGASGSPTKEADLPAGAVPLPIEPQQLEELSAGKEYHYRIVAHNEAGTTDGEDSTFTTSPRQPPIVESESSAQVAQTTATINGTVNPDGLQTSYVLEVGTQVEGRVLYTPTFGEVGSGTESVALAFGLTNLLPGTTYYYRIVAINQDGVVTGGELAFATPSFANPIIEPPHPLIIPVPPEEKHVTKVETKLEKALKACKAKPKKKRAACDRQAEKKYGPKVKKKTNKKKK
jgi:hypothetical protein